MEVSTYVRKLDPGLLDRLPALPPEFPNRSIGRAADEQKLEGIDVLIEWPCTPHGRARRILTRSGARRRYSVPCFRGGERFAHCESPEEATAAVLLDACCGIEFQEHPAIIRFRWRNAWQEHRPDTLVVCGDRKEFWELKKDHEALDLCVRRRSEHLAKLLQPLGLRYRLVSTRSLCASSYYRNAIELRRRAKLLAKKPEWATRLLERVSNQQKVCAGLVLGNIAEDERLDALCSHLYHGTLRGDLSTPVSLDMHVRPPLPNKGEAPWLWELFERNS